MFIPIHSIVSLRWRFMHTVVAEYRAPQADQIPGAAMAGERQLLHRGGEVDRIMVQMKLQEKIGRESVSRPPV